MKISLPRLLIISLLFFTSCNHIGKPLDFDYGRVENNKYLNSFFNFEMTLPKDWKVQTAEQMEATVRKGTDLIAGDDSKMKAVLKASEITTASLLTVSEYEQGAAVDYNPSIAVVAENVKSSPGIKTGNEYLFQARKLLAQSQLKYDHIDEKFEKQNINGTDFYKMGAEINYMGLNIKQIYHSAIINGFSFVVVTSYVTDEQKEELTKSVNSMKFN